MQHSSDEELAFYDWAIVEHERQCALFRGRKMRQLRGPSLNAGARRRYDPAKRRAKWLRCRAALR